MWLMEINLSLGLALDLPWTHYIHMVETWEKANISLPIIYFGPRHGDYMEMTFFIETPKWES